MTSISGELERLTEALGDGKAVTSAEMWAEELVARIECISGRYKWQRDNNTAIGILASGAKLEVTGDETLQELRIRISWSRDAPSGSKNVGKYIQEAMSNIQANLRNSGWNMGTPTGSSTHAEVLGTMPVRSAYQRIEESAATLQTALQELQF